MKTLIIRLTAPLQSYGDEATFNRRTSNYYPSKSAIIGMVAAALGYRRDDERISKLNELKVAVRIDQPGKFLTDFQVVEYQQTSSKKSKKITYRSYLQDAVFVVAICANDTEIDIIKDALKKPKFQLFLGRRANVPAGPLVLEEFSEDPVSVLKDLSWKASDWYQEKFRRDEFPAEIIADANLLPNEKSFLVKDAVGSFNQKHRYHNYRAIVKYHQMLTNPCSEHDAMKPL